MVPKKRVFTGVKLQPSSCQLQLGKPWLLKIQQGRDLCRVSVLLLLLLLYLFIRPVHLSLHMQHTAIFMALAATTVNPCHYFSHAERICLCYCADPLHLLAYGSDASFYRLLPKAVIKVHNEKEVQQLIKLSQQHQVPVTFRAAGTSLSGQAITDSIIISVVGG